MKRSPALWALLFLAACGFTPLHSRDYTQSLRADLSSIDVRVDHSRYGQLLESEIKQGANPGFKQSEKIYVMKIALSENEVPLFINPDGTSSRGDIQYTSKYIITRIIDGKVVAHGLISRVSSYNTSQSADYASFVSQTDAKTRGIIELAQVYKLRLANLLPQLNGKVVPPPEEPSEAVPQIIPLPTQLQTRIP